MKEAFRVSKSRIIQANVDPKRIGSIGWSLGGGWSIKLAEDQPKLAAFVVNYGPLPADPTLIARIRAPMLGNFGVKDKGIPPASVRAFEKAMNNAGKSVDIRIYQAGHGFSNPDQGSGYESEAAVDSQRRSDAFFERYLK
jgi:carboxymethylenebutenolidase